MALFQSQNHKHTQKRLKKRLTQDQVRLLESSFSHDMKLEPERKFQLARELGLQPRQVAIWYQNRKARWKTQTLELDYNTLHVRLDSVLADKKRLEREVLRLRAELQKAQEMLIGLNSNVLSSSSMSTYAEENRTSGLPGDRNCSWENAGALQVDELYACLMGSEAQTRQTARLNSQNLVA